MDADARWGESPECELPWSAAMQTVYAQVRLAAPSAISVLLSGETGVGKEVLARTIHALSERATQPFLALNCATLSDNLFESELFGHQRGAFAGALRARTGLFEAGKAGTLLLDEVSELSASAQAKLLRVVEERSVTRLGSNRARPIHVRFIAATNRDLAADCAAGRFRSDLYFRLNGLSLHIPPLRERRGEIPQLARLFLERGCQQLARSEAPRLGADTLTHLMNYDWPGNLRELRNVMERAALLCKGDAVLPEHLPLCVIQERLVCPIADQETLEAVESLANTGLQQAIRSFEQERIIDALKQAGGIQSRAARMLGISRGTLIARITAYQLPRPRKRQVVPGTQRGG